MDVCWVLSSLFRKRDELSDAKRGEKHDFKSHDELDKVWRMIPRDLCGSDIGCDDGGNNGGECDPSNSMGDICDFAEVWIMFVCVLDCGSAHFDDCIEASGLRGGQEGILLGRGFVAMMVLCVEEVFAKECKVCDVATEIHGDAEDGHGKDGVCVIDADLEEDDDDDEGSRESVFNVSGLGRGESELKACAEDEKEDDHGAEAEVERCCFDMGVESYIGESMDECHVRSDCVLHGVVDPIFGGLVLVFSHYDTKGAKE